MTSVTVTETEHITATEDCCVVLSNLSCVCSLQGVALKVQDYVENPEKWIRSEDPGVQASITPARSVVVSSISHIILELLRRDELSPPSAAY